MISTGDAICEKPFMPIEEFLTEGYMQELNRRFLHPLGLTMAVRYHDDRQELLVIDCRDVAGGVIYEEEDQEHSRIRRRAVEAIGKAWSERSWQRLRKSGFVIQPVDML